MFDFIVPSFIIPDLLLLLFPFIVIGSRLFCDAKSNVPWRIANIGFLLIFMLLNFIPLAGGEGRFFICNWRVDDFGVFMREVLVVSAILGMWFSKDYFMHAAAGKPQMHQIAEFIGAIAFATFGGVTVVSACDTITFFLGLEIATIPMYALTAWNKQDQLGSEAATKYILMGSVATAFELFGFSYLYGFAGSLHFDAIENAVAAGPTPLLWIAVLFLFCGIGFKLTLFPFYTWAPDVYEGAPTPVTAVLSVTSKATAIAFLVSVAVNYLMCMAWVFKGAKDGGLSAKLGFAVTSGIGFFLNLLLMWIFKNTLGEEQLLLTVFRFEIRMYLLNKAIATLLVMVWNYFTKKAILQSSAMRKLADRLKPAKREAQNSPDPEETASDDRSMNDGTDSAKGE